MVVLVVLVVLVSFGVHSILAGFPATTQPKTHLELIVVQQRANRFAQVVEDEKIPVVETAGHFKGRLAFAVV
jgi:hypothetical protein